MRFIDEKEFKERAKLLGATKFTEKHLEHHFSFLGEEIPFTVLLNGKHKNKSVPVEGHNSISTVSKQMAEIFKSRKLPHGNDESYFKKRLLGYDGMTKFRILENISKLFVIIFIGILISIVSIAVSSQITGYASANIFDFNVTEKSVGLGIIVFLISVYSMSKIFLRNK